MVPTETAQPATRLRRWPPTFWIGLGVILLCEILLIADVRLSGRGAVHDQAQRLAIGEPATWYAEAARWVAVNMTPLAWLGYIVLLDGLLVRLTGTSPIRLRPHHFATLALASVFIWCIFDLINFNLGMKAWIYIGMPGAAGIPGSFDDRLWGYLIAFGAIVPGMLLSGQALMELGAFDWAMVRGGGKMPHWGLWASIATGLAMLAWVLLARSPVTNYVLWTSLVFLLDPINYWLGRPSMFRDWERGWYGRTLAAFAGGLMCGFLWEFWNYWALTKWTYHLPFLGAAENYRYFEMPLPGLLGFIPFGMECWVMWQMIRIPLDGLVEEPRGVRDLA